MRVLGFSVMWDKLSWDVFTTFRFIRKDRDWEEGEQVKVVFQPRRKGGGDILGVADILLKETRLGAVDDAEAQADGFTDARDMERWMIKAHGEAKTWQPMNKLTLRWVK